MIQFFCFLWVRGCNGGVRCSIQLDGAAVLTNFLTILFLTRPHQTVQQIPCDRKTQKLTSIKMDKAVLINVAMVNPTRVLLLLCFYTAEWTEAEPNSNEIKGIIFNRRMYLVGHRMMRTVWVEHQRKAVLFCPGTDEKQNRITYEHTEKKSINLLHRDPEISVNCPGFFMSSLLCVRNKHCS